MNFEENPKNQKEKISLTPEHQASVQEVSPVKTVEMMSDDEAQEIIGNDAKRIQEIQQELKGRVSSEPVGDTSGAVPVDSKEDRMRRLTNAAKFIATETFYEKAPDDFLRSLGLPEKKHIAMYKEMVERANQQLIRNHDLTEEQKKWHLAYKADAEAKLNDMKLAQGMTRQRITDGIEKQQYRQQNGYGIVNRVKGRFQAWSLGRQLKNFDANIEQYKQKTIKENGDFYQ